MVISTSLWSIKVDFKQCFLYIAISPVHVYIKTYVNNTIELKNFFTLFQPTVSGKNLQGDRSIVKNRFPTKEYTICDLLKA